MKAVGGGGRGGRRNITAHGPKFASRRTLSRFTIAIALFYVIRPMYFYGRSFICAIITDDRKFARAHPPSPSCAPADPLLRQGIDIRVGTLISMVKATVGRSSTRWSSVIVMRASFLGGGRQRAGR